MLKIKKAIVSLILACIGITGTVVDSSFWRNLAYSGLIYAIPSISTATEQLNPSEAEFNNYLLKLPDEVKWKLYLYKRTLEEGLAYKDYSKLKRIGYCESGWRQYNTDGSVLAGRVHPPDSGIFQINSAVWQEAANLIGYDLKTPEGNIDFALWLYKEQGTAPWLWSKSCWSKR